MVNYLELQKMSKSALPFFDLDAGKWYNEQQFKEAVSSGELNKNDLIYFRASSVGKLMTYPEKQAVPDGAMSEIKKIANRLIYGTSPNLNTFAIEKGRSCEDLGIDLYNEVKNTFLQKNKTRMYYWHPNHGVLLTGECDLNEKLAGGVFTKTIDIKLAYSTESMPLFLEHGDRKQYEWQLDGYNVLFRSDQSELAYCMISTPEPLIKRGEPENWHFVDHIDQELRLSTIERQRDSNRINQLMNRLALCKQEVLKLLAIRNFDTSRLIVVGEADEE